MKISNEILLDNYKYNICNIDYEDGELKLYTYHKKDNSFNLEINLYLCPVESRSDSIDLLVSS